MPPVPPCRRFLTSPIQSAQLTRNTTLQKTVIGSPSTAAQSESPRASALTPAPCQPLRRTASDLQWRYAVAPPAIDAAPPHAIPHQNHRFSGDRDGVRIGASAGGVETFSSIGSVPFRRLAILPGLESDAHLHLPPRANRQQPFDQGDEKANPGDEEQKVQNRAQIEKKAKLIQPRFRGCKKFCVSAFWR